MKSANKFVKLDAGISNLWNFNVDYPVQKKILAMSGIEKCQLELFLQVNSHKQ